ncbi:NAD(P)H oxidoreductase [Nocardia ignorata]|uniref:Putative NADPH-quinone reductase n=1 Tax=Nocardia ignorata TaxID=145285 RepID=A0A4R6PJX6_NOCIG|nr:NAD(P)H oxidoreductase [Nocardia ignorata]TDP38437.1 putative NADPH-quinone reductase [Nocardia ignorata]
MSQPSATPESARTATPPAPTGLDRAASAGESAVDRRALVVLSHHRADSLSAHVADRAVARLIAAGYAIDFLDLHRENFDPRMTVADQPEWGNRDKVYSATTEAHMRRVQAADVIVVVFPVYWQSVPAMLKGWIDSVWNYGFAYGRSKPKLAGKRILWLGLAGATAGDAIVPGMQQLLEAQLNEGLAYYSGFADSRVGLLPDAEDQPQSIDAEGNLVIGDAIAGDARAAHYAAFDARAEGFVDELLAAELVNA